LPDAGGASSSWPSANGRRRRMDLVPLAASSHAAAPKGCRRFLISTQPTTDVRERPAVPSRFHSWIVNRDALHSSHPWRLTQRAAEGSLKRKATCGPRVGLGSPPHKAVQSCQPPHQQKKRPHAGSSISRSRRSVADDIAAGDLVGAPGRRGAIGVPPFRFSGGIFSASFPESRREPGHHNVA
jgi:hypothetical protein